MTVDVPLGWRAVSSDPNDASVVEERAKILRSAVRPPVRNRLDIILPLCVGQIVADLGCVDHFADAALRPSSLHRQISAKATRCIGVDILSEGVAVLSAEGFDALVADVTIPPSAELIARGPFDTVVAGELIEHLMDVGALFEFAAELLLPGGSFVFTSPNPYAPHRVRSGQLGLGWENVDHALYIFPAGVAELCQRTGFELRTFASVTRRKELSLRRQIRLGLALRFKRDQVPPCDRGKLVSPLELLSLKLSKRRQLLGETLVYVASKL